MEGGRLTRRLLCVKTTFRLAFHPHPTGRALYGCIVLLLLLLLPQYQGAFIIQNKRKHAFIHVVVVVTAAVVCVIITHAKSLGRTDTRPDPPCVCVKASFGDK